MPRYQARMSTKPARQAVTVEVKPFDFNSIPWSSEQTNIITWALTGTGNGIVDAVAGSGKTTVLCGVDHTQKYGLAASLRDAGCQFYAFGAKIADALKQRGVAASTFHSAGFKSFRGRFGYHKPSEYKYANLLRDWAEDNAPQNCREENLEEQFKNTVKIWNMLRVNYLPVDAESIETIAGKYDCETQDMAWTLKACTFFHLVMVSPKCLANYGIDFTDQIYIPVALDLHIDQHAFLLVDEAQDLNNLQRLLVRKMMLPGGRVLFVGDPCQPAGTLVSVVREPSKGGKAAVIVQVPIENLAIGDKVVSYTQSDLAFVQNGREVLGITKRPYTGNLVTVTTASGITSKYTPNHHCFASFEPLRDKFAVYLMRRGNQFRIGKAAMDHGDSSGPIGRAHQEKADAVWILSIHDTSNNAGMMESAYAGKFGLPQLTFQASGGNDSRRQGDLDTIWSYIGDNTGNAENCLLAFKRELAFPLWHSDSTYASLKRPMIVHASNLINGCIMLPYEGTPHTSRANWQSIVISYEKYTGNVFSLTVDCEQLYIADNLVTHNCQAIFGFAGADCDSMSKIASEFNTVSLPMYTCRRCCEAALEVARQWNPNIVGKPNNIAGFVENIYESGVAGTIKGTDNMVICRTTAPLLGMAFSLIRQGIGATVIGRDICDSILISLKQVVNAVGYTWDDFIGSLDRFEQASVESLSRRKNSDQAIIAVQDRCECLRVIYDKCRAEGHLRGIPDLQETIKALFSDNNVAGKVTCTTIHRAKGLEAEYVYWLRPNLCPHPMAKSVESQLQERHLRYVAASRCKLGMYQVYEDTK